jgi:phosphoribosylformimino-5-aminoimidazole carboxamide ribotide isomerase
MLTIIPAIDLMDGKCVRLSKGDYNLKKVYNEDPLEVAMAFEDHGMYRLHLVDLDGARANHVVNWKVLERIAGHTSLVIDFGGGLKSDHDLQIVLNGGAQLVTIGSVAVSDRDLFYQWLNRYGAEKIILGADVYERKIAIAGWQEITDIGIIDFLEEYNKLGIKHVLCTDIGKDGMLEGTSVELYKDLLQHFQSLSLIASGGITHMDELHRLNELGVSGAIIGKAIYEGKIGLNELTSFITGNI